MYFKSFNIFHFVVVSLNFSIPNYDHFYSSTKFLPKHWELLTLPTSLVVNLFWQCVHESALMLLLYVPRGQTEQSPLNKSLKDPGVQSTWSNLNYKL